MTVPGGPKSAVSRERRQVAVDHAAYAKGAVSTLIATARRNLALCPAEHRRPSEVDYRSKTSSCSQCGSEAYLAMIEPIKEAGMQDYRFRPCRTASCSAVARCAGRGKCDRAVAHRRFEFREPSRMATAALWRVLMLTPVRSALCAWVSGFGVSPWRPPHSVILSNRERSQKGITRPATAPDRDRPAIRRSAGFWLPRSMICRRGPMNGWPAGFTFFRGNTADLSMT